MTGPAGPTEPASRPRFRTDGADLVVVDPVCNARYPIGTGDRPEPRPAESTGFRFPVDAAVAVRAPELVFPYVVPTCIRDDAGETVARTEHYAYETLPAGRYVVEVMAPIRLYVAVEGPLTVASADDRLAIETGSGEVHIGARSRHDRPAATVRTTADPDDLARAISTFGSGLKTTGPERSLPSLRGHPPRLEFADELSIPSGLEPPGAVELVVPPDRSAVYAAASLAAYLGATVRTGSTPRIETDGFSRRLGPTATASTPAFERAVEDVLERIFLLECVVRTEGLYTIDLDERRRLEERMDLPAADLYDAPIGDRLAAAAEIPGDALAELGPRWGLVVHTTGDRDGIASLPFLANDLAKIRAAPAVKSVGDPPPGADVGTLARAAGDPARGAQSAGTGDRAEPYVSAPAADAFEQGWLGSGVPTDANKLLHAGFEHGLDGSPAEGGIEVTLVCTDDRMAGEVDGDLYGGREDLPFAVDVHRNPTVADLRGLLAAGDVLHYVGHVEGGGFVCSDGVLDPDSLESVGTGAVIVNGCRSYRTGVALVEAGAAGAIATVSDVGNADAIAVGRLLAGLLNAGFTLRSAVDLARSRRLVGNQYVVVGDGGAAAAQAGGGVPTRCRIEPADDNYRLTVTFYHARDGMGGVSIPYIDGVDRYVLSGSSPTFSVGAGQLRRFLRLERIPVEYDGELYWSTDEALVERLD
ncbi:hypothetical protein [Saliphagus sp. LR7]|uniref:hypothetical protein n=1 Tax=Saliphagus sp. LR7 TaxID=2282654 RepID=UPI000DF7EE70|nr:hypothetical protein [Saliphagus sp. LR7]